MIVSISHSFDVRENAFDDSLGLFTVCEMVVLAIPHLATFGDLTLDTTHHLAAGIITI